MTLFAPDLYRHFAIGFLGAGLAIVATTFDDNGLTTSARASETVQPVSADIEVAEEFIIKADAQEAK